MSEAQTITMDMVRNTMQTFCKGNKSVSNAQLYEVLCLKCEKEKDRLRTRITDMIKRGEVIKISAGLYGYNFSFKLHKNVSFLKIWRFVRMQKPGWSFKQICQLTRISYAQVLRYCTYLENEGFIMRFGKDGSATLYRATELADKTPETPYPNMTDKNPFEKENRAAARLATLMLCHNPYHSTVANEIIKNCHILLKRFDKNNNQETGGEE